MSSSLCSASLTACALAIIAGGCASGDEQTIRETFAKLRRAYLTEDYRAACAQMSDAARREVGEIGHQKPTTCPQDMAIKFSAQVLSPRDRIDPKIKSIDVDGERATVHAILVGTTPAVVKFVKQDGTWKLAQMFGTTAGPPPDLR